MTSLIKFERNCGDDKLLFSLIDSKKGTFYIDVKGMSERVAYNLVNFPKSLSPQAAVNSVSLLQQAKIALTDRNITVTPPNDYAQVWAVWLSVFPEGDQQVEGFQDKALTFLKSCHDEDFDLILQFAACCDQQIRSAALARAQSLPNMTLEMRAKLYDHYVDQHLSPEPLDLPKETLSQNPKERFWTNYCIQANKRMPSMEHPRPDTPREGIVSLIDQVGGFANAQIFDPINHVDCQEMCKSLACQPDGAKPWYEEIRIKRAWEQDVTDLVKQLTNDFHQRAQAADFAIRLECQNLAAIRWTECADSMRFYISGRAAISRNGEGKELLPHVEEFLESDARVMLIQGDSGSGKTSAVMNIERALSARENAYITHYVRLLHLGDQSLKEYLKETIGPEYKEQGQFLFLLDGYDEIKCQTNLITQENLKEWKQSKFLFTCRTQHLKDRYKDNFKFVNNLNRPIHSSLHELYMSPFNDEEKKSYIRKVTRSKTNLDLDQFENQLNAMPRLKEMASLPFVLAILTEVLPELKDNSLRSEVYEKFARKRFNDEKLRLNLDVGVDDEFHEFSADLAYEMMIHKDQIIALTKITRYRSRFSQSKNPYAHLMQSDETIISLARTGSMIRGLGNNSYEFLHPSLRDYFAAVRLMQLLQHDQRDEFGKIYLSSEPEVVDFLAEMIWTLSDEERTSITDRLSSIIEASKKGNVNDDAVDDNDEEHVDDIVVKASSNAATILARTGIGFSGKDLRGVKLTNANLNGAIFHHTDLRGATLNGVQLDKLQMIKTSLPVPELDMIEQYQWPEFIKDFHGDNQTQHRNLGKVSCVCKSSDGMKILTGGFDGTARIWNISSGICENVLRGQLMSIAEVCWLKDDEIFTRSGNETFAYWKRIQVSTNDAKQWCIVNQSGASSIIGFGCKIDRTTEISTSNRTYLEQRFLEEDS